MKRFLAIVLTVAMLASLSTCFVINSSARLLDGNTMEVVKAATAPNVTDGVIDSVYIKMFDMTGSELYTDPTSNKGTDYRNGAFYSGNQDASRYDKDLYPVKEDSEWYNTNIQGFGAWDDNKFYYAVQITTPHKMNNNPTGEWYLDGVEIAMASSLGPTSYKFSQNNGNIMAKWNICNGMSSASKPSGKDPKAHAFYSSVDGRIPEGSFTMVKDGSSDGKYIYVYEFAFNWKSFINTKINEGISIPFDMTIELNMDGGTSSSWCGFQIGQGCYGGEGKADLATKGNKIKLVTSHTHTPDGSVRVLQEPTCEKDGVKGAYCETCGEILNKEVVKATGHKQGDNPDVVITPATCGAEGTKGYVCSVCNKNVVSDEKIPATGLHTTTHIVIKEATCSEQGQEGDKCSVCNQTVNITSTAVNPSNHKAESLEWKVTKPSTFTETGLQDQVCKDCKVKVQSDVVVPVRGYEKAVSDSINALIAYLDNVSFKVDGKAFTTVLKEKLTAYEATSNATTYLAIIDAWDEWGASDADSGVVFRTKTLVDAINLFPTYTDENGDEVGLSDCSSKMTPKAVASLMLKADETLYLVPFHADLANYAENGTADSELAKKFAEIDNAATSSAASAAFVDALAYMDENYPLASYAELVVAAELAKAVVANENGDPELLNALKEIVDALDLSAYAPVGFNSYKPAVGADSFKLDAEATSESCSNILLALVPALNDYAVTVPAPEMTANETEAWVPGSESGLTFDTTAQSADEIIGFFLDVNYADYEDVFNYLTNQFGDFEDAGAAALADEELSEEVPEAVLEKLIELMNKVISPENCVLKETDNGIVVELTPEYLETLEAGEHTLSMVTLFGETEATFEVDEKPVAPGNSDDGNTTPSDDNKKPADTSDADYTVWFVLSLVSAGCVVLLAASKKRLCK